MDFDLVPTEELIDAVMARFDTVVFVGQQNLAKGSLSVMRRGKGSGLEMIAVLRLVEFEFMMQLFQDLTHGEEEGK